MRTLLLMRHAKSDWDQPGLSDIERPINQRGQDTASQMGAWMKAQHIQPEWIICSNACRAQQTLAGLRQHLTIPDSLIHIEEGAYLATPDSLLALLANCPSDMDHILVIAHNPGLEELLYHLCGPDLPLSDKGKLMPTATLAQVALDDDWQQLLAGSGKLIAITRPRELTP